MTITEDILDEIGPCVTTPRDRIRLLIAELEGHYGIDAATPATLPLTQAYDAVRKLEGV